MSRGKCLLFFLEQGRNEQGEVTLVLFKTGKELAGGSVSCSFWNRRGMSREKCLLFFLEQERMSRGKCLFVLFKTGKE